jgi:hypothetical protein
MGCTCSREEARGLISNEIKKYHNPYIIKINIPRSDKLKLIIYDGKSEEMLITDIINSAFFSKENAADLDANFISIYDPKNKMFNYYIQRLIGYEIDDENPEGGKLWMVYVNRTRFDWSFLCSKNRILKKNDEIEFRFENS